MQRLSVIRFVILVVVMLISIVSVQAQDEEASDENLIEGMFDVGGLELYMRCAGTGSPTIVYLHGWITNHDYSGASSARTIQSKMRENHRFCIYDRRNVGLSDQVEGYWTGRTAVADLHTLLDVAGIEPPYVLLGASFGGLLSHMYAATYPDDVLGMVMLDSGVPPEILLDYLVEPEKRLKYGDDIGTNEEIDHFATYHEAIALPPPDIPLIYMHATPTGWTWDDPEWDAAIVPTIRDYVDTLDPGIWVEVESPHFMEAAVPDAIIEQLHNLMDLIEACTEASDDELCSG